ncbi:MULTISPECIES: ABC transporter substrate-binding protein [Providencia]|uniref:ABC transporter substrate-binding protein n=1 Tax=Providencia TaxID=586 RepID=UPI001C5B86E9|nr:MULTISPECIES: ABC transporter substrate-binding protein [Providencia]ELR5152079.1 ABC transporter substrate-binding protein [Providencia rettgeri]QXX84433.1 ABC transporter substrate-binding protein [Providencia sp. R33]
MMISRFINKYCLFGLLSLFGAATSFAAPITVTDIAGREVTVNAPVSRVMLADSRVLVALNILHPQSPLKGIIAWDDALIKKAPDLSAAYSKKFPELSKIPVFPNPYTTDFSVEKALVAQPDLLIFDIGLQSKLTESGTLSLLEKSGLPVIFIDFRQYPLKNTMPSMTLLGQVFGEPQQAEAFNQFYQQRLDLIRSKVATLDKGQRPSVFIERAAGISGEDYCCKTFGNGNFGEFVEIAGGNNLGSQWFSTGMGGEINEEQLIHSNPDYYLMTAADWDSTRKGSSSVPLGYTGDKAKSQARLTKLMERPKLRSLSAYQNKQVLALYQQYYDTPFNIIAVEAIAKFLHPNLFTELDPQADSDYLHKTFTALEGDGVFWVKAE